MAQHDDFIADRVWSDMDMDLRQRAANGAATASTFTLPQHLKPDPNALSNVTAATVSWTPTTTATTATNSSLPLHIKSDPNVAVSSSHLPQPSQQPAPQLSTSTATHPGQFISNTSQPLYPTFPPQQATVATLPQPSTDVTTMRHNSSAPNTNHNHNTSNHSTATNHAHQLPLTSRHDPTYLSPLQSYALSAAHGAPSAMPSVSAPGIGAPPAKPTVTELPRWNRPPLHPHNHLAHQAPTASPYANTHHHHAASLPTAQYAPAYPSYPSFPPTDAATARSTELMERALRDASSTGAVSSSDPLLQHSRSGTNPGVAGGPIVTPLTDADRLTSFTMDATSMSARSPLQGAPMGVIGKTKQRRRYAKPKSSRYCHLCARHERAVKMFPCGNVELGICQKSVCLKCFEMYQLDLAAARLPRSPATPRWTCPHCQNSCPKKAKCHSYDRQTERRRMRTRELKRQLKLKVQTCREASFPAS